MLKPILTSEEFAAIDSSWHEHYTAVGDGTGTYRIDLGASVFLSDQDPVGLVSALTNERQQHTATKGKFNLIVAERDAAKRAAELSSATKEGDVSAIKDVFTKQMADMKSSFEGQLKEEKKRQKLQQLEVANQHVRNVALKIATDTFGSNAGIMLLNVQERLVAKPAEQIGQLPTVEYLNAQLQPDLAATEKSFTDSLLTDDRFKAMVVVSKASGGSANGVGTSVSVSTAKQDGSKKTFVDYSSSDLVTLSRENPDAYKQLLETKTNVTTF